MTYNYGTIKTCQSEPPLPTGLQIVLLRASIKEDVTIMFCNIIQSISCCYLFTDNFDIVWPLFIFGVMIEWILSKNCLSRIGIPGSHVFSGFDKFFTRIFKFCIFIRKQYSKNWLKTYSESPDFKELSMLTCGSRD